MKNIKLTCKKFELIVGQTNNLADKFALVIGKDGAAFDCDEV